MTGDDGESIFFMGYSAMDADNVAIPDILQGYGDKPEKHRVK